MGRNSKLKLVSSKERVDRMTLEEFAHQVRDQAHWEQILASAPSDESRAELENTVGRFLAWRSPRPCGNLRCDRGQPATKLPVLVFYGSDGVRLGELICPALCPECLDAVKGPDDMLSDALWASTVEGFAQAQKYPDRTLTLLRFDAIQ